MYQAFLYYVRLRCSSFFSVVERRMLFFSVVEDKRVCRATLLPRQLINGLKDVLSS